MEAAPFTKNDVQQVAALEPAGWYDIRPAFEFYTGSEYCFPIKLTEDNRLIGTGAAIIHDDIAWLGHIIVHPEYRNKGLGGFITRELIKIADKWKCTSIQLIATDMGVPVYKKAGFTEDTEYLFFKDITPDSGNENFENIISYTPGLKQAILDFDKLNSSESRSCHMLKHLDKGFTYFKDNILLGFYLPTFGEGLILADVPEAGMALLKFHLQSHDKVVLPQENKIALDYLYERGYKVYRTGTRMWLRKKIVVKYANIYNRIGGNLG